MTRYDLVDKSKMLVKIRIHWNIAFENINLCLFYFFRSGLTKSQNFYTQKLCRFISHSTPSTTEMITQSCSATCWIIAIGATQRLSSAFSQVKSHWSQCVVGPFTHRTHILMDIAHDSHVVTWIWLEERKGGNGKEGSTINSVTNVRFYHKC